jgi:ABC-type polysaccharide/polyol phosphate export permease
MLWIKSKVFWIALVTILLEIGGYILTNNLFPDYTAWVALGVAALGFISTAISNASTAAKTNAKLLEVKASMVKMESQVRSINNRGPSINNS